MSIGLVRIDELLMPVSRLTLVRGGLEVRAELHGPFSAASGNPRLFSPKGEPVTELARGDSRWVDIPAAGPTDSVGLTWTLRFTNWEVT